MRRTLWLALLLLCLGAPSWADEIPPSLRGLSKTRMAQVEIFYHPKRTKLMKKGGELKSLSTQLNFKVKSRVKISASEAGSDYIDLLFENSKGEEIGSLGFAPGGGQLFIPGNGNLYLRNEAGNGKFSYRKGKLKEVKQPFKYVGRKEKLSLPSKGIIELCGPYEGPKKLVLYREKSLKSARVATLALGAEVEVLLRDGDWFLIRTPFGLLGWASYYNHHFSLFGIYQSCAG